MRSNKFFGIARYLQDNEHVSSTAVTDVLFWENDR